MAMLNPLLMNDWEIKKFLKIMLSIQLAVWGVIGIDVPILRQIVVFIYLTFIPGIIILRVFRLHKLGIIETLLFSVGLSITFLMISGLSMNFFYPFFGIFKPLSFIPLLITLSVIIILLLILSFLRDKGFSDSCYINVNDVFSPPALFLLLLPIISVLGGYSVRYYHINIFLFLLIIVIVLIIILATFDKAIPKKLYPLSILMIAIALLFHNSLLSPYLFGSDIMIEHYLYKLVEINSYWDSSIPETVNGMISVTILPTIYSNLLNMEGTWIFKIIYPLIFSFVPLGLYHIYNSQTDEKTAFISVFFFISYIGFFLTMLYLARQQIAELFFVLLILLILKRNMNLMKRSALIILFSSSLIISHYSIAYIFTFYILLSGCLLHLIWNKKAIITKTIINIFIVMAISWYFFSSGSASFKAIINVGDKAVSTLFKDMFNVGARGSDVSMLIGAKSTSSFGHDIGRFVFQVTMFFIVVGFLVTILNHKSMKFNEGYIALSFTSFVILIISIILPNFITSFNMDRMYTITLLFLSPFCILGGEAIFRAASKLFKFIQLDKYYYIKILTVFVLVPYFLYNVGFIYEITGDIPTSVPLSMNRMEYSENVKTKSIFYAQYVSEQDVSGVRWLSNNSGNNKRIYADGFNMWTVIGYNIPFSKRMDYVDPDANVLQLTSTTKFTHMAYYIYIGSMNTKGGIIYGWEDGISNTTGIEPLLQKGGKIYSNSGSEIFIITGDEK